MRYTLGEEEEDVKRVLAPWHPPVAPELFCIYLGEHGGVGDVLEDACVEVAVGLDGGVHDDGVVLEQGERELRLEASCPVSDGRKEGRHVELHDVEHADLGAQGGDGQHCRVVVASGIVSIAAFLLRLDAKII